MVCLSAHSGGYRVAGACLAVGGVNVDEAYLFDALYGSVAEYRTWVVATKNERGRARHKLVSHYVGGKVRDNNLELLAALEQAGVRCHHELIPGQLSRSQLTTGAAIFIAAPLEHGKVTFLHNGLRDCLFASGLRRHLDSDWFENKDQGRAIDLRS
jgi:hypothetical protein